MVALYAIFLRTRTEMKVRGVSAWSSSQKWSCSTLLNKTQTWNRSSFQSTEHEATIETGTYRAVSRLPRLELAFLRLRFSIELDGGGEAAVEGEYPLCTGDRGQTIHFVYLREAFSNSARVDAGAFHLQLDGIRWRLKVSKVKNKSENWTKFTNIWQYVPSMIF